MKPSSTNFPFAQTMFVPSSALRDSLEQATSRFWNGQEQILHTMQEYAEDWFERRQAGVQEAQEAYQQMINASTPAEAMREYQKWVMGSFGRVVEDSVSCQKQLWSIGGLLAPPLSPSAERSEVEAEEPRRRTQSRESRAAAA